MIFVLPGSQAWAQDGGGAFWSQPAVADDSSDVERLLFQALAASNGRDRAAFAEVVGALSRRAPDHPGTLYFRAVQMSRGGREAQARELLESVLAMGVEVPGVPAEYVHYDLALCLSRLGELEGARRAYAGALQRARGGLHESTYLAGSAEISMALGELERASAEYRRALEFSPSYPHALFGMALSEERRGNHSVARGYLLDGLLADAGGQQFLSDTTVFVPEADRRFAAGLIAEELGNHAEALAQLEAFAQVASETNHPHVGAGTEALGRVRAAGPAVVGSGRLPLADVSAVAVDPRGRYVALGNVRGQLLFANLKDQKVHAAPALSGPGVIAMAFAGDTLLVADDFGDVTPYATRGAVKRGAPRGPVALAGGTRVLGMSPEGEVLVVSDPRGRVLRVADTEKLNGFEGAMTVTVGDPAVVAVGPWTASRGALFTAVYSTARTLELVYGPNGASNRVIQVPSPAGKLSSTTWDAVTITPDGRRLILAGRRFLAVCRTADGRIVRLLDLGGDEKLGKVVAAVVDPRGAAGHGPALLTLHERGYRAIRLDLFE